jgi:DNA-binding MarR family transcriptional regulator
MSRKAVRPAGLPGTPSAALRRRWDSYGLLHIPYRLLTLAKMLDRTLSTTTLRGESLTLAEWRVMANLARLVESTANAIADDAQVDRAEVSRAMRLLEQRGLAERADHPTNRAKKLLRLTDKGRETAERIGRERRDFYTYLLAELSEEQQQQFDDFLLHLAIRVEQHEALTGAI